MPLLLLHGMMGEPANWAHLFPYLPSNCRAVALNLPFFEDKADLNDIPAIQAYVRGYIEQAGMERVVLVGNSLGGHVALRLAMEMPRCIAGLVLTGSSGLFEREFGSQQGANPPREWYYNKMCEVFYDDLWVTDELVDMVCGILSSRPCRRVLVSIAKSAKRDNLAARLGEVVCPVLLIWGRQDEITPPEVAEEFRSLLPRGALAWLDRCGHAAMMERPKPFAEALGAWWRETICEEGSLKAAI
jgi:2-hydroxy-6-oxonona-2,4-dienedioate hydrolase